MWTLHVHRETMFIYDFREGSRKQFQLGMVWVALELNTPNWGEQSEFQFHPGSPPPPGAPHRVLEDSSQASVSRGSHGVLQPGLPGATDPQPPGFTIGAAKMESLAPKLDVTRCTPDAPLLPTHAHTHSGCKMETSRRGRAMAMGTRGAGT